MAKKKCCANALGAVRQTPRQQFPPPVVSSCACPAGEVAAVSDPELPYTQTFTKNGNVPEAIAFGGLTTASPEWSNPVAGRLQYDGAQPLLVQVHGQFLGRNTAVGNGAIPGTHGFPSLLLRNGLLVQQSLWFEELTTDGAPGASGGRMFHVQALLPANPGDYFEIGIVLDGTFLDTETADLQIDVLDLTAK